jgi:glycosyltransferase involved in cell wall biosynthesis
MISVIIPALNEGKYISLILSQFTKEIRNKFNIEVIVSDGGSTDNTAEISRKYTDMVILNESGHRQTIAEGRNIGAQQARGDILFFINADTSIDKIEFFFESILKEIERPGISAITCKVQVFPNEENLSDKIFHTFHNAYFAALNYIGVGMGRGECHILKREMFFRAGCYNEKIIAGEDFELFTRLARIGKIKFMRNLRIFESPRRYRKYGYLRIMASWFRNCVYIVLFKKSIPEEWEVIR